jgi:PAS domain S-box-containing protein
MQSGAKDVFESLNAHQLLDGFLKLSNEGFLICDIAQTILFFSRGAEDIFKYSADEVNGRTIDVLLPERFLADHARYMAHFAEHGRDNLYMGARRQVFGLRKTGEEFPAQISVRKIDATPGLFFAVIVKDSTEWSDTQRSLSDVLAEAQAADRAKSAFLATISHEIRTPLNGILGMAQVFDQSGLSPAQQQQLGVIRQSSLDLLAIVNDVLDLSKIEAGQIEIEETEFELEATLVAVCDVFAKAAERKGLEFVFTADGLPGLIKGDPTRIRQILYNLISNAVKFTAEGEIRVEARRNRNMLRVDIKDTGEGISAEAQRRLFRPFVQSDTSVTRKHGGTGLGLAICRRLADLMGGTVTVRSKLGQGSTFTLELPLVEAVVPTTEPPALAPHGLQVASGHLSALKVLVAEDNATNRMVLKTVLQSFGVEPVFAEDGDEAVAAWRAGEFDLVLMDVQMPRLSGVDATRQIRKLEAGADRSHTVIVGLTANAFREQHVAYRAAGMDEVLTKPVDLGQIYALLTLAAENGAGSGA